ncbi:MAG: hypothetical protein EKK48_17710 [Candidatus Melainabacteria bacterium]|nr:MAG: hypothetical protein EKK48_17710 [Candidatus Melainabacteria bacterium]
MPDVPSERKPGNEDIAKAEANRRMLEQSNNSSRGSLLNRGQVSFEETLSVNNPVVPSELNAHKTVQIPSQAKTPDFQAVSPDAPRPTAIDQPVSDSVKSSVVPPVSYEGRTSDTQTGVNRPGPPGGRETSYQLQASTVDTTRPGDNIAAKAPDAETGTTTRTIGPIAITTTPDGKTTVSKEAPGSSRQPTVADQPTVASVPQGGLQQPSRVTELQPRQIASTTEVPDSVSQPRVAEKIDPASNPVRGASGIPLEAGIVNRPSANVSESPPSIKAAGLTPESKGIPANSNDVGFREGVSSNKPGAAGNSFDASSRQIPLAVDSSSVNKPTVDKTLSVSDGRNADSSAIKVANLQTPSEAQSKPQLSSSPLETQSKANSTPNASALESPVRPNPGVSTDAPGKQTSVSALDAQGKLNTAGSSDSFGTRRETGIQMPETKQTTGRIESGVQLPDTKQSSGRTESGIAQAPDARSNTGRNDSNSTRLPDSKTLANLDQKVGDKLNPPNKDTGLPIPMPAGGLPDILGGLRGERDNKSVKDVKVDSAPSREGSTRGDSQGNKDIKDAKNEPTGGKDAGFKSGDGKTSQDVRVSSQDTKAGTDAKAVQDVRVPSQDTKTGADGRSADVKQQGGSNLVHDGGTKSDGASGNRSDLSGKSGERSIGLSDKTSGDKGNNSIADKVTNAIADKGGSAISDKGSHAVADKGGPDKITGDKVPSEKSTGEGKTRVEAPTPRVVDPDGRSLGIKSDATTRIGVGEKGPSDSVSGAGTKGGSRADGQLVLPPGSLPVPDLVSGVRNIAQQIDLRGGKSQTDEKVVRQQEPGKAGDGVKTVVTGGTGEGIKTALTGVTGEGVKTVVTGGVGDGSKISATGGVGDGSKISATGGVGDGSKISATGGAGDGTKGGAKPGDAGALVVTPSVVPLAEMVGNLKAIASRIFPPEAKTGRPDAFENSLPGRKTERLEDRAQAPTAGVRPESTIPIVRAIGERIGKSDEQFVIKAPQSQVENTGLPQSRVDSSKSLPPWIAPAEESGSGKFADHRNADIDNAIPRATKISDSEQVRSDTPRGLKAPENHPLLEESHDLVIHDEAAEKLLSNLELIGSIESSAAVELEEEEIFPLAAVEYFGGDFERSISSEDEVAFDGDGTVADDDEQSTRYQYVVEAGDTVELIAIKVFKNVTLAPLIYEINKESIPIGMQDGRMVFTLKVGTIIWLPFPKEIKAYMQGLGASPA